jgi:hypothetical protein
MIHRHRYGRSALALQGAQGLAGLAFALGLLLTAQPAGPVIWALAAAAGLFLVYFGRAIVRSLTRIELDERSIRARGPLGAVIPWEEMRALRLNHYSTRGDRSGGWMQLDVRGARRSIRVDSSLNDFAALAAAAGREALRRGVQLDDRTRLNLDGLGISLHG